MTRFTRRLAWRPFDSDVLVIWERMEEARERVRVAKKIKVSGWAARAHQ